MEEQKTRWSLSHLLGAVSVLLILGSLFSRSSVVIGSLSLGVAISFANYTLLSALVRRLLGLTEASKTRLLLTFLLKFLLVFMIIGLILLKTHVRALPLLVGLSSFVVAALLLALKDLFHA